MANNNNFEQFINENGDVVLRAGDVLRFETDVGYHELTRPAHDGEDFVIPAHLLNMLMRRTAEAEAGEWVSVHKKFNDYVSRKLRYVKNKELLVITNLAKLKSDYEEVLRGKAMGDAKSLLASIKQIDALQHALRGELLMLCAMKFYKHDYAESMRQKQKDYLQKYIELGAENQAIEEGSKSKTIIYCARGEGEDDEMKKGEGAFLEQCDEGKKIYQWCEQHWTNYEAAKSVKDKEDPDEVLTDKKFEDWCDENTTKYSEQQIAAALRCVKDSYAKAGAIW